jgi:hypothetical protein
MTGSGTGGRVPRTGGRAQGAGPGGSDNEQGTVVTSIEGPQ